MKNELIIREYKPGDPSRVTHFYYKLYEKQFDFKPISEKYFMESMLSIFDDDEGNQLWIAEQNNKIVGSIGIVKKGNSEAQLRLFGVDERIQGKGLGSKLMSIAMNFCKEKDYKHIVLWTIDILKPAKNLQKMISKK